MSPESHRPIVTIVLGMHRSGTSALTGLLMRMGLETGDNLLPANSHNPVGHFEDTEVLAIDEGILRKLGAVWHCPVSVEKLKQALAAGDLDAERAQARRLLRGRIDRYPLWLVKDPRWSVLLPFWVELLRDLDIPFRFAWIIRKPMEVAASLHARDKLEADHAIQLWTASNLTILQNLQGASTCLLDYDSLVESPYRMAHSLAVYLGFNLDKAELARIADESIHPELHASRQKQVADHPLYLQLRALAPGILDTAQLEALWQEWAPRVPHLFAAWSWAGRVDAWSRDLTERLTCCAEALRQTETRKIEFAADNVRLRAMVEAEQQVKLQFEAQARQLEERSRQLEERAAESARVEECLRADIQAIKLSRSWRLTAPLRWAVQHLRTGR